jgi:hypothetical protein
MGFQLWLADVLRGAGLTVHEVAGWRTRSAEEDKDASSFAPRGVIIHETRGSSSSTDAGEIGVLVNGRVGLSGPIAQLYVSRTGHWHVVAAGLCHHVKTGWAGPFSGLGNSRLLGIEPAHSADEDWADKPTQYRSYVRGVAAILRHTGWPAPVGHKEHQPGDKPDPEFDMARFRRDVAAVLAGEEEDMTPNQAEQLGEAHHVLTQIPVDGERKPLHVVLVDLVADVRELKARPPSGSVVISDEQLERVLRKVVGSVDEVPPAAG